MQMLDEVDLRKEKNDANAFWIAFSFSGNFMACLLESRINTVRTLIS